MFTPTRCRSCGYFDRGDLHICSACGSPHESRISTDPTLVDTQLSDDWDELRLRRHNSRVQAWITIAVTVIAAVAPVVWYGVIVDHGLSTRAAVHSRLPADYDALISVVFVAASVLFVGSSAHDWQYFYSVVLRWFRPSLVWEISAAVFYLLAVVVIGQASFEPNLLSRTIAPRDGTSTQAALVGAHTVMVIYYGAALTCTVLFLIGTHFNPCDRASLLVRRRTE